MAVPKRVVERISKKLKNYQSILASAKERDINEADTVTIIKDLLEDLFGYDKYSDITSEYAIRGTYCDLAIKVKNRLLLLIEVKAIGLDLKDKHTKQSVDYAANEGCEWVALTNGIEWLIYKIKFAQPIDKEIVLSFNLLEMNHRKTDDIESLYLLSKEGRGNSSLKEFHAQRQAVSRYLIAAAIMGDSVLKEIRKELKKLNPKVRLEIGDIAPVVKQEVLKRDLVDGDKAMDAVKKLNRASARTTRKAEPPPPPEVQG
ncbi:MAG: type I restriction enzyme HsdR N-terminal domain-containing protein [Nitrospinota bacterium]|nr:type I restriction enzyme HsdR N-terminal domain-containing protein [Nitrospinota bacterium]